MSFFCPVHLRFASRVRGLWACIWQCAGFWCTALVIRWVIVANTDQSHSEGTREQEWAAALSWRWLWEVLAGLAAKTKMMS